jgi:hypothetical protein
VRINIVLLYSCLQFPSRFETYNIFALLVGTLIFDVAEDHSQFVTFQVILVLLFIAICLFAIGSQFWYVRNQRSTASSLLTLPAARFDNQGGTIVVSQPWQTNLPDIVLSVNPIVARSPEKPLSGLANSI